MGVRYWLGALFSGQAPAAPSGGFWYPLIILSSTYVGTTAGMSLRRKPAPSDAAPQTPQSVVSAQRSGLLGLLFESVLPDDPKFLGLTWRQRWQSVFWSLITVFGALGLTYCCASVFTGNAPGGRLDFVAFAPPLFALLGFSGWSFYLRRQLKSND